MGGNLIFAVHLHQLENIDSVSLVEFTFMTITVLKEMAAKSVFKSLAQNYNILSVLLYFFNKMSTLNFFSLQAFEKQMLLAFRIHKTHKPHILVNRLFTLNRKAVLGVIPTD